MASCLPLSELSPISRQTDAASISFLLPLVAFWTTAHWVWKVIPKPFRHTKAYKCHFVQGEVFFIWQPPSSKDSTRCAPTSHKAIPNGNQYEDGRKRKSYWGNELQEEMEGEKGRERVTAAAGCSLTHSVTYSTHFVFARNEQSVFLLSGQHMLAWTGYHSNAPGLV